MLFLRIRRFPPKRKLLTLDEYAEQGVIETRKALEELKFFCSSPESKPWKTVSRLKNPKRYKTHHSQMLYASYILLVNFIRFASFVEGESHVHDDEVLLHLSTDDLNRFGELDEPNESDISDDEDDLDSTPVAVSNRSVRSPLPRKLSGLVNSRISNGSRPQPNFGNADVEISDDD